MKKAVKLIQSLLTALPLIVVMGLQSAKAQPIIPANDGTATLVTPDGDRFDIHGGSLSGDGTNLFHSFQEFGLDAGQIANFLSNPSIQNILSRVNGGNPSVINGLIQLTGGNSNLYLMNPAGIIFGSNASLNLPAHFSATTATGIGFADGSFDALTNSNNYAALNGEIQSFQFNTDQPGVVINGGDLNVTEGNHVALIGGTVVNTGNINAPGGNVMITAVPGQNTVRISVPGNVLSLEITPPTDDQGNSMAIAPQMLPDLLLGKGNTGLEVTPDNQVQLSTSGTTIPTTPGTAIVSGSINTASSQNGGQVQVLGDTVGVINANINASGDRGGGTVLIGGDYQGQGTIPTAQRTYINPNSVIEADALSEGDGGKVIVWSDQVTGYSGSIRARGGAQSGNGGFVEVSGKESLAFNGQVNVEAPNGHSGVVLLDPRDIIIQPQGSGPNNNNQISPGIDEEILFNDGGAATDFSIEDTALTALTGSIRLEAQRDIIGQSGTNLTFANQTSGETIRFNAGRHIEINSDIKTAGGSIDFSALTGDIRVQNIETLSSTGSGSITLTAVGSIDTTAGILRTSSESSNGGAVSLNATGNINTATIDTSSNFGSGGSITLNSSAGSVNTNAGLGLTALETDTDQLNVSALISGSENQVGGDINITAASDINAGLITSAGRDQGGNISLNSSNGSINATTTVELEGEQAIVGAMISGSDLGNGGNIILSAPGDIRTGLLGSLTLAEGQGGEINVTSTNGAIDTTYGARFSNISFDLLTEVGVSSRIAEQFTPSASSFSAIASGSYRGDGGNINLNAAENVTTGIMSSASLGSGTGGNITVNSASGGIDATTTLELEGEQTTIGAILSGSSAGDGGSITLNSLGDIRTGFLGSLSLGEGRGGEINVTSTNGAIDTTYGAQFSNISANLLTQVGVDSTWANLLAPASGNLGAIASGSYLGDGGNINLNAGQNLTTGMITSAALENGQGGNITLNSGGSINTNLTLQSGNDQQIIGAIISGSRNGNGGSVDITATDDLSTGMIFSASLGGNAGSVTLQSTGGNIDTAAGASIQGLSPELLLKFGIEPDLANMLSPVVISPGILAFSESGNGGDVTLLGEGNITTSNIVTGSFYNDGGNITISSNNGFIDTTPAILWQNVDNELLTRLELGIDSDILTLMDYFNSQQIGGLITLSLTGNAGNISLNAANDILTNYLIASSFSGQGGAINLNSQAGQVNIGQITFNAANGIAPGNIISDNQDLEQLVDLVSRGNLNSSGSVGNEITVEAGTTITAGAVNSSGTNGNGGNVILESSDDIEVTSVNAQGGNNGRGGNVDLETEGFVRVTGTFSDRNNILSSISAAGGTGGGSITIRHGGGGITPFLVGDPTLNGTAGAISNGEFTITEGDFLFTYREGDLAIISVEDDSDPTDNQGQNIAQLIGTEQPAQPLNLDEARQILRRIEQETGIKPAVVYPTFVPSYIGGSVNFVQRETNLTQEYENYLELSQRERRTSLSFEESDTDELQLILVTSEGESIPIRVPGITRQQVLEVAQSFYRQVANLGENYLAPSQQLYQWLIAPLETQLQEKGVNNLLFAMPQGLRLIPVAALHDGTQFVAQKYSSGLSPSLSLVDNRYRNIENLQVLAMGASTFPPSEDQTDLPAVQVEIQTIANEIWSGKGLLNEEFTLENLKSIRQETPYGIIHLATHADFSSGDSSQSYIQLFDRKLRLNEVRELGWNDPPVELLVLSACRSAFGDEQAELGFGGMAVQTGVKSALASLWFVGDTGTLGLMSEFYRQLGTVSTKAEALRQTQVAMIEGTLRKEGNEIVGLGQSLTLPNTSDAEVPEDLSHPFYWAAFTLIGSPW